MITFLSTVVAGVGTYLSRSVFILALARTRIPDNIRLALDFVAPAVLGALVITLLIDDSGSVAMGIPEVSALAVGGATTYQTRNHILTLVLGMTVYWVVRALI